MSLRNIAVAVVLGLARASDDDRDACGRAATAADWARIEEELRRAYEALKFAVARN